MEVTMNFLSLKRLLSAFVCVVGINVPVMHAFSLQPITAPVAVLAHRAYESLPAFSLQPITAPVTALAQSVYACVPSKVKVLTVVAVGAGVAGYGYWHAYKNFKSLDSLNDLFETPIRVQTQYWLSLWNIDQWSSAVSIKADNATVQRELAQAVHGRSLRIKSEDGSVKIITTWIDLQDALVKEIEMLNALQQKLENKYLVYGKALRKDGFGIVRDYKNLCGIDTAQQEAPSYAMHHWSSQTYKNIDSSMREQICANHWWHWVTRPNYGTASRVWWQLLTLSYRLAALQEVVNAQVMAERTTGAPCKFVISATR
jgi:hypothetical protein